MNFDDTPDEAAFRAEARGWIEVNAPHELMPALKRCGPGSLDLGRVEPVAAQKAWQRRKFEAGWACPHWPRAYGGRDATPVQRAIWHQEEGLFGLLSALFSNGQGMGGPTIMAVADEATKRRLLPRIASGDDVWCQLFSEPGAGSDLAAVRTRAARLGQDWIINGQKIWTSEAQYSDYGLLLARSDPALPKHKGLTMFFLDMRSPGVSIRPIRQMNGLTTFNEVFFDDVRIDDSQRLGAENKGWQVALTTLMNERLSIGSSMPNGFEELFAFCAAQRSDGTCELDNPGVRSRLAAWAVRASGLRTMALRTLSALANGAVPGPENSVGKLVAGTMLQEIAEFAIELQGPQGALSESAAAADSARFQAMLLRAPATRIEGGTDEILRNIIAERVLGLPREGQAL